MDREREGIHALKVVYYYNAGSRANKIKQIR